MALFGEKYGDVVRMVEIGEGEYSRELCGGTHVRSTAEIGPFRILSETSSAANVRRIEAVTGPAAVELLREHDRLLGEIAASCARAPRTPPRPCARSPSERKALEKALKQGGGAARPRPVDVDALAARRRGVDGAQRARRGGRGRRREGAARRCSTASRAGSADARDRARHAPAEGRVHLVASVAPGARRARRQGRRGRQGRGRGRRRRRRRARHDGAGRRARPREARARRSTRARPRSRRRSPRRLARPWSSRAMRVLGARLRQRALRLRA